MNSMQPELPDEEEIANDLDSGEEPQAQDRLEQRQQRNDNQESRTSDPVIINR